MNQKPEKKDIIRLHNEKISKLMENTIVYNDTTFHAMDEALAHLIEHFDPNEKDEKQDNDHVLLIGEAFFGEPLDGSNSRSARCVYMDGDIHQLSHTMADIMHLNREFYLCIIHAVQVYEAKARNMNRGN